MNRAAARQGSEEEWTFDNFANLGIPELMQLVGSFMPIVKLKKEDSFLLGTEAKQVNMRGENIMVRVGGGYVTIAEYYNKYSVKQCVQLYHIMAANSQKFKDTVLDLMQKNQCSDDLINAYHNDLDEDSWEYINQLFVILTATLEVKSKEEAQKAASPNRSSKKKKKKAAAP